MYIHFFLSVCVCVCLLDPISFNWLPFFFYLCLALASHFKYFRRVCSVLRVCVCVCLVSCCCRCCCCCCCYFIALFGSVLLLLLLCFRLLVFPHSIIFIISNISSILHPANWIWRHLDTEWNNGALKNQIKLQRHFQRNRNKINSSNNNKNESTQINKWINFDSAPIFHFPFQVHILTVNL